MSLVGTDVEEAVQGFGVVKGRVTAEHAGNISVQWPDGEISQMPLRRLQRLNERTATREQATVELQQTEAAAEQVAADDERHPPVRRRWFQQYAYKPVSFLSGLFWSVSANDVVLLFPGLF